MEKCFVSDVISLFSLAVVLLPCCYAQNSQDDYLPVHNRARAEVGIAPFSWSQKLVDDASLYLTNSVLSKCELGYQLSKDGYNIQVGEAGDITGTGGLTGAGAVEIWVSQRVNYDHNRNMCLPLTICTAYTQVVWRDSVSVGCATLQCNNNMLLTAVACKYDPAGNLPGQSPY